MELWNYSYGKLGMAFVFCCCYVIVCTFVFVERDFNLIILVEIDILTTFSFVEI